MPKPVGEIKKLVSLVDRGDADEFFYPKDATHTVFQQNFIPYHNFSQEIVELPYTGAANWGQRITFTMPYPWQGDCLSWIAIRFAPNSWLSEGTIRGLSNSDPSKRSQYNDVSGTWLWAEGLGSSSIELVEMEVNGVVIERWSGDWMNVWQKVFLDNSRNSGWSDSVVGGLNKTVLRRDLGSGSGFYDNPNGEASRINTNNVDPIKPNFPLNLEPEYLEKLNAQYDQASAKLNLNTFDNLSTIIPTEDGSVYAYFPFWFARHRNSAFPLASINGEGNVRFHITFRKFTDVIRKVLDRRTSCDETMLGKNIEIIDNSSLLPVIKDTVIMNVTPDLKDAVLVCGLIHLDGSLRESYIKLPHEIMTEPVLNIPFNEPLKYVVNTGHSDTITVSLPLDAANGPIREIIWFVRRKAVYKFNSWTNYGTYLEDELDVDFKPQRPLLTRAILRVGAVVWADQDELWWRSRGALMHPGGVQLMNSFIYAYSFADDPTKFGPSGSVNASRVPLRLDLTILPPVDVENKEWEVQVFILSTNWMKFQNGIAEQVFKD